mmetsp:Transcript_8962/g.13731  ORF Transcript_8962/g.13731 Transcript_8962/m.13731 type:complete len:98 (+) Transcript_8962:149-442(+)
MMPRLDKVKMNLSSMDVASWENFNQIIGQNLKVLHNTNIQFNSELEKLDTWFKHSYSQKYKASLHSRADDENDDDDIEQARGELLEQINGENLERKN